MNTKGDGYSGEQYKGSFGDVDSGTSDKGD